MFLSFIRDDMLVVDVDHRADAKAVQDYLQEKISWENQTVRENGAMSGQNDLSPDR